MAQFDVYINPNSKTNKNIPYLLDVQHDNLSHTDTRVVIPLMIDIEDFKYLNPKFTIENNLLVLSTIEIASIAKYNIGKKVCSLKDKRTEIIGAIDFLITGY